MNIYSAIMRAADHIEQNPGEFTFMAIEIPGGPGCGTPGCALGWIGHFSKAAANKEWGYGPNSIRISKVARNINYPDQTSMLGITQEDFYERVDGVFGSFEWKYSADKCAAALRLYAAKYHSEDKRTLPDSVTRIFTMTNAELKEALEA